MASAIARLYAELDLKNSGFLKGEKEVEASTSRMKKFLGGAATAATGFLAATVIQKGFGAVVGQIGGIISAASDMNETISKTDAVFGGSAKAVESWGDTAADRLLMTKQAALEAASTLGNLFKGVGVGGSDVAKFSENIVTASADLASFDNLNPADVLNDLQSGLVGEFEPLRKYGIVLNEASVQQEALKETGKASASELTEGEKVIARYNLIMSKLGDSQGDALKTGNGWANGIRRLQAHLRNLEAEIGGKILPVLARGVAFLNRFFMRMDALRKKGVRPLTAALRSLHVSLDQALGKKRGGEVFAVVQRFLRDLPHIRDEAEKLGRSLLRMGEIAAKILLPPLRFVAGHLGTIVPLVLALAAGIKVATLGMKAFAVAEAIVEAVTAILDIELSPLILIMAAIGAAVALFALAWYKNWFGIRQITAKVVGFVVGVFERLWAILKGGKGLHAALDGLPKPLQKVAILARRLVVLFGDLIHGRWDKVRGDLENIGRTLGNLFKSVGLKNFGQEFKREFDLVVNVVSDVITLVGDLIHGRWGKLWGDFVQIVKDLVGLGIEYFRMSLALWKDVLSGLVALFNAIPWGTIWDAFKAAVGWVVDTGIPLLLGYGMQLIGALWHGATAVWAGSVRPWLHDRIDAIAKALGDFYGAAYGWGASLINGIWDSVTTLWNNVTGWVSQHMSPGALAASIGSYYDAFYGFGASIIAGLWNGISAGWDAFKQMVTGLFNELPDWAKWAWEHRSPSHLFERLGVANMLGLAIGTEKMIPHLQRTMARVTAAVASGMPTYRGGSPSLATRPIAPALTSIRGGNARAMMGGPISIKVEVNGANMTNEEVGEVAAAAIMRRLHTIRQGVA